MKFLFKYAIYIGLAFYSSPFHALEIIPENMEVKFPGMYISGSGQNADANPANSQIYVVRFYVEGEPGKRSWFRSLLSSISTILVNPNVFVLKSSILVAAYQSEAEQKSKAMEEANCCALVRVKIGANHPAGVYTSTIPFEVNYK